MTARLILVCHGSTDALRAMAFPADEPLDHHGRLRAAALAGNLPKADMAWAGPELRTRQTAEGLNLDSTVLPMLRDCDYGAWKGRTFQDICEREPEAVAAWLSDPAAAPHGGESVFDLMRRMAEWLAGELEHHRQSVAVTHPSVIRAAIVQAIEAPPQSFWRIDIAPLSVTRLSGVHGRWNLVSTGAVARSGAL